jgi:TetR/AcrR family transcriptional repressor of nem operon
MEMKERILEIAKRLIQQRGVNGFSYADIAKELEIAKASLHHHYATKTALVNALMEQYTDQLTSYLDELTGQNTSYQAKITAYMNLYAHTLSCDRICMGGMLSAEAITLDESVLPLLKRFFDIQQTWLTTQLQEGKLAGEFTFAHDAESEACNMISALQGALIVSRSTQNKVFFENTVQGVLAHLSH